MHWDVPKFPWLWFEVVLVLEVNWLCCDLPNLVVIKDRGLHTAWQGIRRSVPPPLVFPHHVWGVTTSIFKCYRIFAGIFVAAFLSLHSPSPTFSVPLLLFAPLFPPACFLLHVFLFLFSLSIYILEIGEIGEILPGEILPVRKYREMPSGETGHPYLTLFTRERGICPHLLLIS